MAFFRTSLSSLRIRFSRRNFSFSSRSSASATLAVSALPNCLIHLFSVESPTPKSTETSRRVRPLVSAIRTASCLNSSLLLLDISLSPLRLILLSKDRN
ncbi:hypothetical protein OA238_118p0150 (plasmid) [Octadecabacter arcticus 238]|uniref:Uncharacterized protein n=1 Tax=Octadecabacter arcticus 238 TaxID=391616 RepID=M9RQ02_9RHOB|nr:hypothetical protein OA238_118p0150 [Octadecabacter arcticus 238]